MKTIRKFLITVLAFSLFTMCSVTYAAASPFDQLMGKCTQDQDLLNIATDTYQSVLAGYLIQDKADMITKDIPDSNIKNAAITGPYAVIMPLGKPVGKDDQAMLNVFASKKVWGFIVWDDNEPIADFYLQKDGSEYKFFELFNSNVAKALYKSMTQLKATEPNSAIILALGSDQFVLNPDSNVSLIEVGENKHPIKSFSELVLAINQTIDDNSNRDPYVRGGSSIQQYLYQAKPVQWGMIFVLVGVCIAALAIGSILFLKLIIKKKHSIINTKKTFTIY